MAQPDGRQRRPSRGEARAKVVTELRRARPVARTRLARGTVVWARIPFAEDPDGSKLRPAVVSSVEGRTVTVFPVTSSRKESVRRSTLYVLLNDWADAGLTRPCLVTRKAVAIDRIAVATVAGALSHDDAGRVFG